MSNIMQIGKKLSIISSISILMALIIVILIPEAKGYEISIYAAYPFYFWVLLSIPISISFLKVIMEDKSDYFTFIILGSALFSLFILFGLPFFRGYSFYGAGDTLTHLGMIKDIIISGHIGSHNPYPIIHLLIVNLSIISNIKYETLTLFLPIIFNILFIISIFLFSKSLGFSKKESLFMMLFSILPVLGTGLTTEDIAPSLQVFLFIPLALFIFFKSRKSEKMMEFSILLIFSLFLIAFYHPEPLIYLSVFFVSLYFISRFGKKINKQVNIPDFYKRIPSPLIFLLVASLAWFSTTYFFGKTTMQIYNIFVLNLQSAAPPVATLMGGFHISTFDVALTILKQYGIMLIYLFIGICFVVYTVFRIILKKNISSQNLLLTSIFSGFAITGLFFLMKGTSIGIQVLRPIKYSLLIAIMILGMYFATYIKNCDIKSKLNVLIIVAFVFILPLLAITSTYPTTSMQLYNYQPAESNIQGMEFFLTNRNKTILTSEILPFSYQTRYADYILGYEASKSNLFGNKNVPSHFGYNTTSDLGSYYKEKQYLIMYPPSLIYYPQIYPNYQNLWKFNATDFTNLEYKDITVNEYYNNGDFKLFIIND